MARSNFHQLWDAAFLYRCDLQGVGQVEAISTLAAVRHQIHLKEPWAVFFPVSKGANMNGALKQAPRFGGIKGVTPPKPAPGLSSRPKDS